jgi:transposase-like protein
MKEIACPNCSSKQIKKHGIKRKKLQTLQRYFCNSCKKTFTLQQKESRSKTYPISIILNALSNYNVGYSQTDVLKALSKRFKIKPSQKTSSNWLDEYKEICTFASIRKQALKLYTPNNINHKKTLNHIQPYTFKCHKEKLDILLKENPFFMALKVYINKINSNDFPHHIFTYNKSNSNSQRASQLKFNHLKINHIQKQNQANQLAKLAINLANTNKERHQAIQDFMLINDSTTIATEIPVYLTNWDAGYYKNQKGFIFPLNNYKTPITGHIDLLQVRNGSIHILDYKPDADKINSVEQLTIYALALSRKLNLPLYYFKCAWFDENSYYEFFPLHAVYER